MVEAHLRLAIRAGLTEAEFWGLTPYRLSLRLQEAGRARTQEAWLNERFAREKTLNPISHYITDKLAQTVDVAAAMRDWAKQNDARFKAKGG
ncbi:hypothetical protein NI456_01350 [Brevundimonas diminuta]|uniref:hypothetical protein n=1 Tax=Brevundimonas diminuta TaxID=293 RepID=UPI002098549B|nr:hypothetical protein [Brevundimonas diminuta]MCO8017494.1 hypothetical protein [Brevundimonas diminuta]MCO8021014.1 hypothetical protein [Brevundimonas diminuta]